MNEHGSLFFREDRICPWWLIWTFDNPLRRFLQNPETIVGPHVREGMNVADVGCGMGYFSIAMAKMVGENGSVIAVDLQEKMLEFLKRRARKARLTDRIRLLCAKEDDLMLRGTVDFALAFWMVHEVKDIPLFFEQIHSVLKKGGTFLYAEPKIHVSNRRFQEILGYAQQAGFQINNAPQIRFSRAVILSKEG
ncbi:MAG TPA: class I SAM-dependent methyltransferase [Nitrospirota bacterium]|nr:class I SAM-dependent methyltransferase [Nitrospirota bacterium]